jgi:hypothetical protein
MCGLHERHPRPRCHVQTAQVLQHGLRCGGHESPCAPGKLPRVSDSGSCLLSAFICELPDGKSAASAALAASSTGAFGRTETHELFSSEEIGPLLEGAKARAGSYTPPGT